MAKELVFDDITPQETPVRIGGKEYVLREPTGDAETKYRSAIVRGTKFSQNGATATAEGNAEAELLLISLCMFERVTHNNGQVAERPVLLHTVKSWPARITNELFKEVNRLRPKRDTDETPEEMEQQLRELQTRIDLAKAGETSEKNSPSSTTNGSPPPTGSA